MKRKEAVANCSWHDVDSIRHGKIPAKRQYLQGSAETLRGEARSVHVTTADSLPDF